LDFEFSNRNVFILGAGFSAAAGAPVVRDFLDCARQFYDDPVSGLDEHEREHFKKVFEAGEPSRRPARRSTLT
jgi:hypothetical protein